MNKLALVMQIIINFLINKIKEIKFNKKISVHENLQQKTEIKNNLLNNNKILIFHINFHLTTFFIKNKAHNLINC